MSLCVGSMILSTGCAKKGCTDSDATNYNSAAKKDDNSCTFKTGLVIWYNQATSTALVAAGAGSMTYYVNGQVIGSSAATVYNTSEPSCGGGAAHSSYDLGNSKTKTYSYSVKVDYPTGSTTGGDTVIVEYSGSLTLNAHNSCLALQLQ